MHPTRVTLSVAFEAACDPEGLCAIANPTCNAAIATAVPKFRIAWHLRDAGRKARIACA